MNGKVLLEGISDFWLRYFEDAPILIGMHEGALAAAGASYQRMLLSLMRLSSRDAPLTETVPWHNLQVREDTVIPVGPEGFLWALREGVRDLSLIHNVVFSPTAVLELGYDFEIVANSAQRLSELRVYNPGVPTSGWFLLFKKDLFNWDRAEQACPGFAVVSTSLDQLRRVTSTQVPNWTTLGLSPGDVLRVVSPAGAVHCAYVQTVAVSYVEVTSRSRFPGAVSSGLLTAGDEYPNYDNIFGRGSPVSSAISRIPTRVRTLSGWAPYADVDFYSLYDLYGMALSNAREPSTEDYRAFVQGVWNLYVGGPALQRIESAMNVVCGYPVVRENDEEIYEITNTSVQTHIAGILTSNSYQFPIGTPLHSSVVAAAQIYKTVRRDGKLTLFTDLTLLAGAGFLERGVLAGVSTLSVANLDAGGAIVVVDVLFVFDAYVQVETEILFPVGAWSIKNGNVIVAAGIAGDFYANSPVPKLFKAFDTFTSVCSVTDYVETPGWWETSAIPAAIVPGLPYSRRVVTPEINPNMVNAAGDLARIGDYGLLIGQSDDGTVPSGLGLRYLYDSATPEGFAEFGVEPGQVVTVYDRHEGHIARTVLACGKYWLACAENESFDCEDFKTAGAFVTQVGVRYRLAGMPLGASRSTGSLDFAPGGHHLLSWLLARDFLQWNMFSVSFDVENAQFARSQAFILDLIMRARPAYAFPYVRSDAGLSENYETFAVTTDSISVRWMLGLNEQSLGIENFITVGARAYTDFVDNSTNVSLANIVQPGYFVQIDGTKYRVSNASSYPTPAKDVTGTLCVFAGANNLVGVGTKFLQELPIGSSINLAGETYYVIAPAMDDLYSDEFVFLDRAWAGVSQVGLVGSVPAAYSNRVRISLESGTPQYGEGLLYRVLDANEQVVFVSTWGSGAVLGGVGMYGNAIVGGMDPLIDRHEVEYTRVGILEAVADSVIKRHLVDGISVANVIPGCTISTNFDAMIISDVPCAVRTINVA